MEFTEEQVAAEIVGQDFQAISLELLTQGSMTEEKVTKRGSTFTVRTVVKNSPFVISLALKNQASLQNFNHLAFDTSLFYDLPDGSGSFEKEVPYVSQKPVDIKPTISGNGNQISFDVKIKVLSSHHEDNFFRLKFFFWDPLDPVFPHLTTMSAPIKVISKPIKQKIQRKSSKKPANKRKANEMMTEDSMDVGRTEIMEEDSPPSSVMDELHKISERQKESLYLLRQLAQERPNDSNPKRVKVEQQIQDPFAVSNSVESSKDDFENSFKTMLNSYSHMSVEEKAERVRKLVRILSGHDLEILEELFDILGTAGVQTTGGPPSFINQMHNEQCAPDCPHKQELVRLDNFYGELFF